jgi:hypothetical protein
MSLGSPEANDLMGKWCDWLFRQTYDYCAAWDVDGKIVQALNMDSSVNKYNDDVWFLPGAFDNKGSPHDRKIFVPNGRRLFIVVGCGHTTPDEYTHENPTDANPDWAKMKARTKGIEGLWNKTDLYINGKKYTQATLLNAEADRLTYVEPGSYYEEQVKSKTGKDCNGCLSMSSSGFVAIMESLGPPGTVHNIRIDAHANGNGKIEDEYTVDVAYTVTVGA